MVSQLKADYGCYHESGGSHLLFIEDLKDLSVAPYTHQPYVERRYEFGRERKRVM
jgi:hypothetical protein